MAMMQPTAAATDAAVGPVPGLPAVVARDRNIAIRALLRMTTAIRSNRKATWGFGLVVFFCLVAAFPGVIAHDNPSAIAFTPSLGPSLRHLLGTTGLGQDMFAQIVYGTRP